MDRSFTIVSGVPASLTVGAGRLILHLVSESLTYGPSVEFIFAGNKCEAAAAFRSRKPIRFFLHACLHFFRKKASYLYLRSISRRPHVVLIHFQEIGIHWCSEFLRRRTRPTWIYILDASYFCIRSYNHIPGESDACLRCLGGHYEHARKQGCKPFPIATPEPLGFMRSLAPLVSSGKVRLLVQNERNAELIRQHYGSDAIVKVVGLWTVDMNNLPDSSPPNWSKAEESPFDVVYHGDSKEVKGLHWALRLAGKSPSLRFLFPCSVPDKQTVPPNCTFLPMRWESGLRDAVQRSRLTLVPSLWSAPIEGALIKSILHAPRVAVVTVPSAYSSELPPELVCHFPSQIDQAAELLLKHINDEPTDRETIREWFLESRKAARLIDRISRVITGASK